MVKHTAVEITRSRTLPLLQLSAVYLINATLGPLFQDDAISGQAWQ
jgi:hypothetical protein